MAEPDERMISWGCTACWALFCTWFPTTQTNRFAEMPAQEPVTAGRGAD